jgi:GT2 family glycosyltransferase
LALTDIIAVSAVVATKDRPACLARALASLKADAVLPAEIIVVDASDDGATKAATLDFSERVAPLGCRMIWQRAERAGAAAQRNQGVTLSTQPAIWFFDDDVVFEPDCLSRLWIALQSDTALGGVNAMIVNQRYLPPGVISRAMFRLMAGRPHQSYAGRVLGPVINMLPEDRDDLPDMVLVEWMNTGCAMYRREALPTPPFPDHFTGYSLMEDVALSMTVAKRWKLANVRRARIFHDSQPAPHKAELAARVKMEMVNRHYIMTHIAVSGTADYVRLVLWHFFQLAVCGVQNKFGRSFWQMLKGSLQGVRVILFGTRR